jgi:hypothetical protein
MSPMILTEPFIDSIRGPVYQWFVRDRHNMCEMFSESRNSDWLASTANLLD